MLDRSFGGPPYYFLAGVHLTVTILSFSILRFDLVIVEQTFSKLKFTYLGIKNAAGPYNLIQRGENNDPALGTCLYVSIRDLHGNL